jgi:hypothetical protein
VVRGQPTRKSKQQTQAQIDRLTEPTRRHGPAAKGVAMTAPENRPTERNTRPMQTKHRAIAVIGAGACIAVAVIAAALFLLS